MVRAGIVTSASVSCFSARSIRWPVSTPPSSIIALGSSMCSNFPVSVAIIQWFEKRRARALSAVQFGSALGGCSCLVAWSIQPTAGGRRPSAPGSSRSWWAGRSPGDPQPPRRSRRDGGRPPPAPKESAHTGRRRDERSPRAKRCAPARSGSSRSATPSRSSWCPPSTCTRSRTSRRPSTTRSRRPRSSSPGDGRPVLGRHGGLDHRRKVRETQGRRDLHADARRRAADAHLCDRPSS